MAPLELLPASTYAPLPPVQAHRKRRSLNTIIEDVEESIDRQKDNEPPSANWFSPMSDHFPTPRGGHFMSAPKIPASPSSTSESIYSQLSSGQSGRDSSGTLATDLATDLGDIYDVSSDEESYRGKNARSGLSRTSSKSMSTASARRKGGTTAVRSSLPTLVIPVTVEKWNAPTFKFSSPIPPTPPPKVPISPALFRYLASQEVLSSSATPSLDGSLSSDQLAAMSAPPTPDVGLEEAEERDNWGGVQLQPNAMATLQALSGDDTFDQPTEQVIEVPHMSPTTEMQQSPPPLITSIRRHNSVVLPPDQQDSLDSLSKLDIPSPGGFFSSLSNSSRYTWHSVPPAPDINEPPTSATAEHFYKTPWASRPIERILEVPEEMSQGFPTARAIIERRDSDETITGAACPEARAEEEIVATEILADYDAKYIQELRAAGFEHIDRTSMWLNAQTTFLPALINPPEERDDETALEKRNAETAEQVEGTSASPSKKMVRFSAVATAIDDRSCPVPKQGQQESAYFRSFQNSLNRSRYRDIYVHRLPRYEALQSQRVNFPEAHRNHLLGKYQLSVVPMSAKKRRESTNVVRGDDNIPDDLEKLKSDKEYEAMDQMRGATWNVMAVKMLNGGRLIAAPIGKRLARQSRAGTTTNITPRNRPRILDLGGESTCDWGWHCAIEYSNTKVYTATTKAIRQISNSNIRGPKNHRRVAMEKLTRLPFKDNQFDIISARNLYGILKVASEHGEDEYQACLAECMRCLKPGGYLEFSLIDSDIINAGAQGQAKSVEFGFNLMTRGYDPSPTKAWLGRLNEAGFVKIKRAWMFLPMGAPLPSGPVNRNSVGVEMPLELEAMITGSTNAVASITGLIGGWAWEKWMLRLEMECGRNGESLDCVYNILEEGRKCGAGWRSLNGWARKPLKSRKDQCTN